MVEKEEKEKGLISYPKNKENPFMANLVVPQRNGMAVVSKKSIPIVDSETGEVEEIFMHIKQKVDKEMFVKLFKSQIQTIFDLTRLGYKIFGYFLNATRINEDMVHFDLEECMEKTGYKSTRSVFEGLAELCKKDIVAKGKTHTLYYINPAIFFNGNRMVVVQDYYMKGSRAMKNPKQYDLLTGSTNKEIKEVQRTTKKKK